MCNNRPEITAVEIRILYLLKHNIIIPPQNECFLGILEPYGLANQRLCYIQMLLNIEKSGGHD